MTIKIELQPQVYQDTLNNLLFGSNDTVLGNFKGVPSGKFTNLEGPVTQFSILDTPFRITTDSVGELHTIRATLISLDNNLTVTGRNRVYEKTVVPVNDTFVVSMPLRKGVSQIEVFTATDGTFTSVTASHVGTFITAYAREIFNSTRNPLDEQNRALFSKFSSRMTEILIPFQDLYADPKSLRTLISRFVTRSYMSKSGATQGIRDFASALLGTTPVFVPTKTDETVFEPDVVPLFRRQLEFSGYEAHTWIPNYEIIHWLSFSKLVNSTRNYYTIQDVGESEVLISANGVQETHRFDFDDPEATAYINFSSADFRVLIDLITDRLFITFCAAGYTFDLFITQDNPLGQRRLTFDSIIDLDSGELLDQPALDPADDGWVGFPLTGRFEQYTANSDPVEYALDSLFITPATGSSIPTCVYDGFFTQQLSLFSQSVTANPNILAWGEVNDVVGTSEENVSIAEFRADTDILDFSNIADFSLTDLQGGTLSSSSSIALAGTSSVKCEKTAYWSSVISGSGKNYNLNNSWTAVSGVDYVAHVLRADGTIEELDIWDSQQLVEQGLGNFSTLQLVDQPVPELGLIPGYDEPITVAVKDSTGDTAGVTPTITWTNPGAPLNLTAIGADTLYLTVYLSENVLTATSAGVPRHPGALRHIGVELVDGSGNTSKYVWHKENLQPGMNVLPLMLDFPDGGITGVLNRADIRTITFSLTPVEPTDVWGGVYLGRMYTLNNEAHFRPARAKIELEDINDVHAQSLYGSTLTFTDHEGVVEIFTGDEVYNDLDENAYIPNLYKVQLTAGAGTEGFDRPVTAENLRLELGRQGTFLKSSVVNNLPGEIYLDVFTPQFSTSGSEHILNFTPDPGNPVTPDLISFTSFQGGLEGQNVRLGAGLGNTSLAQQFTVSGSAATARFVELLLHRLGTPPGRLNVTLHANNLSDPAGTAPGNLITYADEVFAADVPEGVPNYSIFQFNAVSLPVGTYWIVVSGDSVYEAGNDVENHVIWAMATTGSSLRSAASDGVFTAGSFWGVSTGIHHFFKVIGDV